MNKCRSEVLLKQVMKEGGKTEKRNTESKDFMFLRVEWRDVDFFRVVALFNKYWVSGTDEK